MPQSIENKGFYNFEKSLNFNKKAKNREETVIKWKTKFNLVQGRQVRIGNNHIDYKT